MVQGRPSSKEEAGSQREQEERMRCIKAISQAKQGEWWIRWESVEQRKMGWQDLWSMEECRISFLIRSTYDVLVWICTGRHNTVS